MKLEGESSWLGRLKSLFHRPRVIVEASPSTYTEEKRFITIHEERMGEKPKVSFAAQMAVYIADPMARAAVDFLAEQVAGPGFYTTAEDPAAKEFIDEFCESVGMDEMLLQTAREIVAFGNCFWSRAPKSVKIIPILSIERIIRTPRGTVKGYVQSKLYGGKTLDPRFVIHFRWNPVNNEAFGSGLLRTLVESLRIGDGEARMSFAEMKARMQKAMIEQFEKFSAPNELWIFKGLSAAELNSFAKRLKKLPAKGARLAYNDEADIKQATMQLGRGWEAYVETIINDFLLGLQTPIPRLFTTPGFTEASARAALEAAERKVMAMQRFIKRIVERQVFVPMLRDAGFDPVEAKVRLNWGQPEIPELRVQDMLKAVELGVVRIDEARKMLIKSGWELTEP